MSTRTDVNHLQCRANTAATHRAELRGRIEELETIATDQRFETLAKRISGLEKWNRSQNDRIVTIERPKPIVRPPVMRGRTPERKKQDFECYVEGAYLWGCIAIIVIVALYESGVVSV